MPKVTIVTLTYNQPGLIDRLAKSIRDNLKEDFKWVIRDNSTNSETSNLQLQDKRFIITKRKNDGNFASQHNELLKEGFFDDSEYICLLNDDTIAATNFLRPMLDLIARPEIGIVGSTLFFPDGKLQHCGVGFFHDGLPFNINAPAMERLGILNYLPRFDRIYKAVTGACLLISLEDYKKLNGMDEQFQWCFDDVDLCLRMGTELKKLCVTSSESKLVHIENFSTLKNPTNLKPSFQTAWPLLRKKHQRNLYSDWKNYLFDYGRIK